jgi:hypothetical protein
MTITLQHIEQSLLSASGKACLTDTQFECIQDALSGMHMGEVAFQQWVNSWLVQMEGSMSEDDVEYMDTVGWVVNFVNEENYFEQA